MNEETTVPMTRAEMLEYAEATAPGKLVDRYRIYLDNSGEKFPKSFDEWLNS
jgi:hypothetical protein